MTPIEKARAEDSALRILGATRQTSQHDIKAAWRRKVIETHPDRNGGDHVQFQLVQAAYQVANGTAADEVITRVLDTSELDQDTEVANAAEPANMVANPRRARVKTRIVWFDEQIETRNRSEKSTKIEMVELDDRSVQPVATASAQVAAREDQSRNVHTVQRVRQKGRRVSYILSSSVKVGPNRVSVLKGDFRSPGSGYEVDIRFESDATGAATVAIPAEHRDAHFPGAQSVRLHFAHGADRRP